MNQFRWNFAWVSRAPIETFFCFLDHIDLGPYSKDMAVLKQKMPIFWKQSLTKKNVTAQKSLRICFYHYIVGQKIFFIFFEKNFFWNTLWKKYFFTTKNFFSQPILLLLWVTSVFDPKNDPLRHLLQDVSETPPPVQTL